MNSTDTVTGLLAYINAQLTGGKTASLHKSILTVLQVASADPLVLWHDKQYAPLLSQTLLLALIYDVSDDEDELICAAHFSYFYGIRALELEKDAEKQFDVFKNLLVLLGHYSDYIYQTVAMCYRGAEQKTNTQQWADSLHLGRERVLLLELKFLNDVEQLFDDYRDDAFLLEREREVLDTFDFSNENLEEAELLSKVMFGYIAKKIQLNDLDF